MASHEWHMEDMIHIEELDDSCHDEVPHAFSNVYESSSPPTDRTLAPINSTDWSTPEPSIEQSSIFTPDSCMGYDLSDRNSTPSLATSSSPCELSEPNWPLPTRAIQPVHGEYAYPTVHPEQIGSVFDFGLKFTSGLSPASVCPTLIQADSPEPNITRPQSWQPTSQPASAFFNEHQLKRRTLPVMGSSFDWAHDDDTLYTNWSSQFVSTSAPLPPSTAYALPEVDHFSPLSPMESAYTEASDDAVVTTSPGMPPSRTVHSFPDPSPLSHMSSPSLWPSSDLVLSEKLTTPAEQSSGAFDTLDRDILSSTDADQSKDKIPKPTRSEALDAASRKQLYLQIAQQKWGNVGARDAESRHAALLEMKAWGLSYKEIQSIGNYPDKLPTLRGRYRTLTLPPNERVRRPSWKPRDIQLLKDAVKAQTDRHRGTPSDRILWLDVSQYLKDHGASYPFSHVTCSQKWNKLGLSKKSSTRTRAIRGVGAITW
ncbi:hypothetical protein LIA77_04938 [Sarocladium implicatum]|nr:hypothetical protein LIA77_04938 [Sarocladium implicatum]